jgi:hypothetical protein
MPTHCRKHPPQETQRPGRAGCDLVKKAVDLPFQVQADDALIDPLQGQRRERGACSQGLFPGHGALGRQGCCRALSSCSPGQVFLASRTRGHGERSWRGQVAQMARAPVVRHASQDSGPKERSLMPMTNSWQLAIKLMGERETLWVFVWSSSLRGPACGHSCGQEVRGGVVRSAMGAHPSPRGLHSGRTASWFMNRKRGP